MSLKSGTLGPIWKDTVAAIRDLSATPGLRNFSTVIVVHVQVHVKSECVPGFIAATRENARNSLQEAGVARFDVVQQVDEPTRFLLIEVYRTAEAILEHKQTVHYATWRDTVAPMMESPRTSTKYTNLFPDDSSW